MYGKEIDSLEILWANGDLTVIPCEYVGDKKIENLLNAEREGRLISDVEGGFRRRGSSAGGPELPG